MSTKSRDDVRTSFARETAAEFFGTDASVHCEQVSPFVDRVMMPTFDRLIEEISDQAAALRERNRMYGKASETIGRLRAENARLRLERATVKVGATLAEPLPLRPISPLPHKHGCHGCRRDFGAYPRCWTVDDVHADQDRMQSLIAASRGSRSDGV